MTKRAFRCVAAGAWRPAVVAIALSTALAAQAEVFSARDKNAVALKEGGAVVAWGNNAYGNYGDGRLLQDPVPRRVSQLPAITQIWGGHGAVLALDASRRVWAWGDNSSLQLGERDTSENALPGIVRNLADVVQVSGGASHAVALRADGTVWVWGRQAAFGADTARPRRIEGIAGVTAIASGANHILMLRQDRSVWAAGSNQFEVFGSADPASSAVAVAVPGMTNVVRIWAAGARSFAMKSDGTLWDWNGAPAQLPLSGRVTEIRGFPGDLSTEVNLITNAGKVYRFPRPAAGTSGPIPRPGGTADPNPPPREMPVEVPALAGALAVIPGANTGGGLPNDFLVALFPGGRLMAQGGNLQGQLGDGTYSDMPAPGLARPLVGTVIDAAAMVRSVVALLADGSVWVWGSNGRAQLADGANPSPTTPYSTSLSSVVAVSAGGLFSVARRDDGSIWAWGENLHGQFCDGSRVSRSVPAPITSIGDVREIAAAESALAFLKNDGSVWYCGYLGRVDDERLTPFAVPGLPFIVKIFATNHTFFALDASNRLWAFGSNFYGQTGTAPSGTVLAGQTRPAYTLPLASAQVPVISGTIEHVAGADHVLAVTGDGQVWSWGRSDRNQLGKASGGIAFNATPAQVPGVTQARKVAAGTGHSLVLRQDGSLMVWGSNAFGQLGLGNTVTQATPVAMGDLGGFDDVAASDEASYARRADGTVFAWGRNEQSLEAETLGDGTYVTRTLASIVLRERGAGRLDTNDWFLDLKPSVAKSIPVGKVPRVLAVAEGTTEGAINLDAKVTFKQADAGKNVGIYVMGLVPPAFLGQVPRAPGTAALSFTPTAKADSGLILVQLTPQGWSVVTGQLTVLAQGVTSALAGAQSILRGVPGSTIPGARFCIGYAEGGNALLENVELREIAAIPGATTTAAQTGPCLFTGAYLSGPAYASPGSPITFSASVVGIAPTGNVSLLDGVATLATQPLAGSSLALRSTAFTVGALAAGTHNLAASYAGDSSNAPSTSPIVVHTVASRSATSTTLAGPATSQAGSTVSFTATVSSASASGTVRFTSGQELLGAIQVSGGTATLVVSGWQAGVYAVVAEYEGDASFAPSTSSQLTHTVSVASALSLSLAVSNARLLLGSSVTLTATASGGASPAGTVRFFGPEGTLGTAALSGNAASLTVANLPLGRSLLQASLPAAGSNPAITSVPVSVEVVTDPPRLVNISTRMQVLTGDNVMIGGFVIGGSAAKTVVVRARGPSLTALGVPGALANPVLNLYSGQTVIASNDDFGTSANLATLTASGFAPSNAQEAAVLVTLNPGPYTAIVTGAGGSTGVGIIEVFEVDALNVPLINIATRGQVLTGDHVLIGGFIIQGNNPQTVVVRARGPSLTALGVPGALANPTLNLYSGQTVIASNDDFGTAANVAQLQASGFAPANALESAILITLNPGAYTAIVSGAGGGTGVGIVEVFTAP